jgi:hypothetical protein
MGIRIENAGRRLKGRSHFVKYLCAPLHTGGAGRKCLVIDTEGAGDRVDTPIDIIAQHGKGSKCVGGGQTPDGEAKHSVKEQLLQIHYLQVTVSTSCKGALDWKYIPDIIFRKVLSR